MMRKKQKHFFTDKVLFALNVLLSCLIFLAYWSSYSIIKTYPYLGFLTLILPFLLLINLLFAVYWTLQLKNFLVLSLVIFFITFGKIEQFYKMTSEDNNSLKNHDKAFSLMTYNIRLFNKYHWIDDENITEKITVFVKKQNPDIICFQEFDYAKAHFFDYYPHKFIDSNHHHGQAIFSKYPIVKKGILKFPNTSNTTTYVDMIIKMDTIRIYNLHMQSAKVSRYSNQEDSDEPNVLFKKVIKTFEMQSNQVSIIKENFKSCRYRKIVCGDFNNTAFSYSYKHIGEGLKDSFDEKGNGFGKTYEMAGFLPLRIDFVLLDKHIQVVSHTNYINNYSDHFPVKVDFLVPIKRN